jgi:hypothetical protein
MMSNKVHPFDRTPPIFSMEKALSIPSEATISAPN